MYESHFDSLPIFVKYNNHLIVNGTLYIYQDGVEIQSHRGYGIYKGANYLNFRFSKKAAKDLIDYLEIHSYV